MTNTIRALQPHEREALQSYAAEHGRKWKEALRLDWYNARAIGDRGAILHGLRNDPRWGHEGLDAYMLPYRPGALVAHYASAHTKPGWVVCNITKRCDEFGKFGTEREALDAIASYYAGTWAP